MAERVEGTTAPNQMGGASAAIMRSFAALLAEENARTRQLYAEGLSRAAIRARESLLKKFARAFEAVRENPEGATVEQPGNGNEARFISTADYAKRTLGGTRSAKTVATWCREGKLPGAKQITKGTWLVPCNARPPEAPPQPPWGDTRGTDLRGLVRRETTRRAARGR